MEEMLVSGNSLFAFLYFRASGNPIGREGRGFSYGYRIIAPFCISGVWGNLIGCEGRNFSY